MPVRFKNNQNKFVRMDAYCVKCRQKREVKNESETVNAKGLRMLKGQCTVCGTNMSRILGK